MMKLPIDATVLGFIAGLCALGLAEARGSGAAGLAGFGSGSRFLAGCLSGLGLVAVEEGFDVVGDAVTVGLVEHRGSIGEPAQLPIPPAGRRVGVEGEVVDAHGQSDGEVGEDFEGGLGAAGFELSEVGGADPGALSELGLGEPTFGSGRGEAFPETHRRQS
jgi:hypothetical protein